MGKATNRTTMVVECLENIISSDFGGKPKGRYRISRADLLMLSEKKTFNDEYIKKLQTKLQQEGLILIDLGAEFACLEEKPMTKYRKVTKAIIEKQVKTINKKLAKNKKNE